MLQDAGICGRNSSPGQYNNRPGQYNNSPTKKYLHIPQTINKGNIPRATLLYH
jgi:hypothetical protein